ncbi:DUF4397 domain-containing protein [Neiella marina]|uniref:DUF4397 domain-containing protein n=1 Tax=Neiella holothuriorum TaxID=2870530 RepID=A0ABS7EKR4_9GAMM|nr:DUF4397 domain-containing protein [Neiella holothuriorum]MBW8192934.1 DUF4397 domain-containing protein [Neiella holothuriorum]
MEKESKMSVNNNIWKIGLAVLLGVSLTACNISEDEDDDSSTGYGYFRFANLVAGSSDIELVMDDSSFAEIGFAEASELEAVTKGSYDLEFNQILPNTDNDNFIDDSDVTIKTDYIYSYLLYGDDPDAPEALTIRTDVDDLYDDDYDDGQARFQFFQASSDLADVDIYLVEEGDDTLNQSVYTSLSYMSESEEFDHDEGIYKIIVTESGSDSVLIEADNISIEEANAYVFALVSYDIANSDSPRYALVVLDSSGARMVTNDAQTAVVRINNAMANTDGIDVYQTKGDDLTLVASDLYFGESSDGYEMDISDVDDGDNVTFYIYDAGADIETDSALISDDYDVEPDSQRMIVLAGDRTDDVVMASGEQDLSIQKTHAKLIFTHAIDTESSDYLEIVVVEDGGDPDNYNTAVTLSYLGSEEYEIEQGDYQVYVYREDDGVWLAELNLNNLEEADVVSLTVTESQYGGTPYEIQKVVYD